MSAMIQPGFTFDDGNGQRWMVQQAQINSLRDGEVRADFQCMLMSPSVPSAGSGTVSTMNPHLHVSGEMAPLFASGGIVGGGTKENVRKAEQKLAEAKKAHRHAKRERAAKKAEQKRKASARALAIGTLEDIAQNVPDAPSRLAAAERLLVL